MRETAFRYLSQNELRDISIAEPIRRGQAQILHASPKGVMIKLIPEEIVMLTVDSQEEGMELLKSIESPQLIVVHQEFMIEPVQEKYGMSNANVCYQVVYTKKELLPLKKDTDIRQLDESYHEVLCSRYHMLDDPAYIQKLIQQGVMHGIFVENQLAGFIGMHSEGSMGLLEVFLEHQRKGLATELQKYMINFNLEKGWVPFGQVFEDNQESMGLQCKLGMETAHGKVTWISD